MSILHFRYEMQLSFDSMVTDHHFQFRCLPMETESQKVRSLEYRIEPAGAVSERLDGFGNRVCAGEALAPHDYLRLQVEGTVETGAPVEETEGSGPEAPRREQEASEPGSDVLGREQEAPDEVPVECLVYAVPSELTRPGEHLNRFYEQCRNELALRGNPGVEKRSDSDQGSGTEKLPEFFMRRLFGSFSYVPGSTHVGTTAEEALAGGKGVCQDYAQILIALCRMAGCPARYVVGLLPGEGATHAWTEVWQKGRWLGLDPTHNCRTDGQYIRLSHGRDFTDCSVDRGCFKGGAAQKQKIYIKVEEENV